MQPIARISAGPPALPAGRRPSSSAIEGTDRPAAPASLPVARPAPLAQPPHATARPAAAFLAHLIATHAQMPQTRARRRAQADAAAAIYAAVGRMAGAPTESICARMV